MVECGTRYRVHPAEHFNIHISLRLYGRLVGFNFRGRPRSREAACNEAVSSTFIVWPGEIGGQEYRDMLPGRFVGFPPFRIGPDTLIGRTEWGMQARQIHDSHRTPLRTRLRDTLE